MADNSGDANALVTSPDPNHPANRIADLCRLFYTLGWVTGTGGGVSIKHDNHIYLAPSGVQKERMEAFDMFVMDYTTKQYLRRPPALSCHRLTANGCCIHTHSQWAVLVTLICEAGLQNPANFNSRNVFEIKEIEQIKGISRGYRAMAGDLRGACPPTRCICLGWREFSTSVYGLKHLRMVRGSVHEKQSPDTMLRFKTRTQRVKLPVAEQIACTSAEAAKKRLHRTAHTEVRLGSGID
ncbi:Methylthioribulose-1-phosphate [Hortaea werneckii]|nr:Methylthioribulose-1-phosphate [Hortaea werneckii]